MGRRCVPPGTAEVARRQSVGLLVLPHLLELVRRVEGPISGAGFEEPSPVRLIDACCVPLALTIGAEALTARQSGRARAFLPLGADVVKALDDLVLAPLDEPRPV